MPEQKTEVRLLIEKSEGVCAVTAFDEVGQIVRRSGLTKEKLIRLVKEAVEGQIGSDVTYTIQDLTSGQEKEKR